jgi:hypothetical protein
VGRFITWIGVHRGKFYAWKARFGKVNEHNWRIPRVLSAAGRTDRWTRRPSRPSTTSPPPTAWLAGTWPSSPSATASSKPHASGAQSAVARLDTQNVHPRRHPSRSTTIPDFATLSSRESGLRWAST